MKACILISWTERIPPLRIFERALRVMNALHELSVPRPVNVSNKVTKLFAKGSGASFKISLCFFRLWVMVC